MRSFTVRGSESPGSKADVVRASREGAEQIDEIVESGRSPLDSIVRDGARRMLQAALESEVDAFLEEHAVLLDECGRRRVVRNGTLPTREIATGAGILEVSQPRVRDKASIVDERIVFSSKILPPYLRKSRSMEDLIPWLSLKGVSTGDFGEALESLIGPSAKGFSPNVIVRLKERWSGEYDEWSRRDLTGKQYVSIWADGIHVRIRLEDPANPKQCLLVVMGATADGQKELIAVIDGVRESKQSWLELLLDLKNRGSPFHRRSLSPMVRSASGPPCGRPTRRHVSNAAQVHKTANVINSMPKAIQPKAKFDLHQIWLAETREMANKAFDHFLAKYGAKYEASCAALAKDRDVLLAFYDFPAEHWSHLRTTNPIESTFATIRLRHRRTKGSGSRKASLAMMVKLAESAARRWRRLNASHQLTLVIQGRIFTDGVLQNAA